MPVSPNDYAEVVTMKTERAALATKALELDAKVRLEKREFTAEEKGEWATLQTQVDELGVKVETRETFWKALKVDDDAISKLPPHLRGQYQNEGGITELEKRQAKCLTEYFKGDKHAHERPEYRDVQLTTPSSGGFLMLPEQMSNRLLKKVDDIIWMTDYIQSIDLTDTKTLGIPSIETEMDDLTWTTEIATIAENTSLAFGKRALTLSPFRTMIKVSDLWLQTITSKSFYSADNQDGTSVTPMGLIENRLAYHIARTKENNYFNGNGVGKPLGIFTASTRGISTTRDVDQGAAISYAGLVNAKFGLKVQYHASAVWTFHRSSVGTIMKLVDSNNRPLLNFSTIPTQPDTLMGHPIKMSEFCPSTVSSGSYIGMFGGFKMYWAANSKQNRVKIVDQLYAATGQTAFFAMCEGDGMPVQEEAFSRLKISA